MVDQALHDGDEAGVGCRDLVAFQHVEGRLGIEITHGEVGASHVENREHGKHRGDVKHRQRRPETVFVRQPVAVPAEGDGIADLGLVRDQASLRIRRGAGRIEHQSHVAHPHAESRAVHARFVHRLRRRVEFSLRHESGRSRLPDHHHIAQLRGPGNPQVPGVGLRLEVRERRMQPIDEADLLGDGIGGDQSHDVAVLQHIAELRGAITRIDRDDDCAAQGGREEDLDEIRARMHQYAHRVPRLDAHRLQAPRSQQGTRGKLCIAVLGIGKDEGEGVGEAVGGREQEIAHRGHRNPQA